MLGEVLLTDIREFKKLPRQRQRQRERHKTIERPVTKERPCTCVINSGTFIRRAGPSNKVE